MREKRAAAAIVCVHGGGGWEWAIRAHVPAARGFSMLAPDLMRLQARAQRDLTAL